MTTGRGRYRLARVGLGLALATAADTTAVAQTPANVAIVINDASAASREIGRYYASVRRVPAENILRISAPATDVVDRATYTRTIEEPIAAALARQNLQDRILYIVLTKGVPLAIEGTGGREGTRASVDSELTLLYRRQTGVPIPITGAVPNPYFREQADGNVPFTRQTYDLYLVTRLDGFSVEDVRRLIDRASAPTTTGVFVLDRRAQTSEAAADRWLEQTASALQRHVPAERVQLALSPGPHPEPAMGYVSWGSNDPALTSRVPPVTFAPGAIATTFVSTGARTFNEPAPGWSAGSGARMGPFAGSRDGLVADLVRAGATGAVGSVSEPFWDRTVRPDILLPTYVAGRTFAESAYSSLPVLSWQSVVIGDPLCAPFATSGVSRPPDEVAIDPVTELPAELSRRRLAVYAAVAPTLPASAAALLMKSQGREARGDRSGAISAAKEATEAVQGFTAAQTHLASLYQQHGETERAVEVYRELLQVNPRNVIALNNLASLLSEGDALDEALDLARRAVALAPTSGSVIDTLGWIQHRKGNDAEARRLIAEALRFEPGNPDVLLHSAELLATTDPVTARRNLENALRLRPEARMRPDIQALIKQLRGVGVK